MAYQCHNRPAQAQAQAQTYVLHSTADPLADHRPVELGGSF